MIIKEYSPEILELVLAKSCSNIISGNTKIILENERTWYRREHNWNYKMAI